MPRYDKNNPPPGRRYIKKVEGGDKKVLTTPIFFFIKGTVTGEIIKMLMPVSGTITNIYCRVGSFDGPNNRLIINCKPRNSNIASEEIEVILNNGTEKLNVSMAVNEGDLLTITLAGSAMDLTMSMALVGIK